MRRGTRFGVDVGRARVGIARSDRDGLVATPVATLERDTALERMRALLAAEEVLEIVVGLPLSLSGADTRSTLDARTFANELAASQPVTVRLVDERLSTVSAQRALHDAGRTSRRSRRIIDQVAAVIILQNALDTERASGRPPGTVVDATCAHPTREDLDRA